MWAGGLQWIEGDESAEHERHDGPAHRLAFDRADASIGGVAVDPVAADGEQHPQLARAQLLLGLGDSDHRPATLRSGRSILMHPMAANIVDMLLVLSHTRVFNQLLGASPARR